MALYLGCFSKLQIVSTVLCISRVRQPLVLVWGLARVARCLKGKLFSCQSSLTHPKNCEQRDENKNTMTDQGNSAATTTLPKRTSIQKQIYFKGHCYMYSMHFHSLSEILNFIFLAWRCPQVKRPLV